MRKLILRMLLTLDGVAAGDEKGPLDMVDYSDEGSWTDIFATLQSVDAMLLGGGSYREYLGYWQGVPANPKASASERKFADIAMRTPHFVLSRTAGDVSKEFPNARLLEGGVDGIAELKRQPGKDILMWGGPTAAAAVIDAGLFDEYHLETHPAIAGRGKKLFEKVKKVHRLRQIDTKTTPSGVTILKYASV